MLGVNHLQGFGAAGDGSEIALIGTAENQSGTQVTLPAEAEEGHLCIGIQIQDEGDDPDPEWGTPNSDTSGWTIVNHATGGGRYTGGDSYTYDAQYLVICYKTLTATDITNGYVNIPWYNEGSESPNGFVSVYDVLGETVFSDNDESTSSNRTIDPTAFGGDAVIIWGLHIGGNSGLSSNPLGDVVTNSDAWDYSPESTSESTDPVGIKLMLKADFTTFAFQTNNSGSWTNVVHSGYIGIGA